MVVIILWPSYWGKTPENSYDFIESILVLGVKKILLYSLNAYISPKSLFNPDLSILNS